MGSFNQENQTWILHGPSRRLERLEWIENLFNGTWTGDEEIPLGRVARQVQQGDYLYLIYQGRVHGRLRINDVEQAQRTVVVGTDGHPVQARTILWVQCPGERAPGDYPRTLRRGFKYDRVPEWGR